MELEKKFCDMMVGNWTKIQQRGPQLGYSMGTATIIQGDARQLEGILVDEIITSPPYTNRMDGGTRGSRAGMIPYSDEPPDTWPTQRDQTNIGNLPYGKLDAVITSPPYADEPTISKSYLKIRTEIGRDVSQPSQKYEKYGAVPQVPVDSIITSPPYEGQIHPTHETTENVIASNDPKHLGQYSQPMLIEGYGSDNKENIGNLKGDTYLSAMLQVYQQCFKVLKPQGLLILVTKNFIRNKQEVRLDLDTIKLCETAGFTFQERHYRELTAQSFWRTIYKQKYPGAPEIKYENILVFQRPA